MRNTSSIAQPQRQVRSRLLLRQRLPTLLASPDTRFAQQGPLVLFYTPFFKEPPNISAIRCDVPVRWTLDRRQLRHASIVIFHVPNSPDLVRVRKYPGQLWVAWSQESKVNYPRLANPVYLRQFDLIMTYEQHADVWTPYLPRLHDWSSMLARPVPEKTEAAPLVMFQSADVDQSGRTELVTELFRYVRIDSYGSLFRNRRLAGPDTGHNSKLNTVARYHFCLALENSIAPDYVTEKIFDALRAGSVPVYLGAPNVRDFVPQASFIDVNAHGGSRGLARYLNHLAASPDEYASYHAWRKQPLPPALLSRIASVETEAFCRLLSISATRMETQPYRQDQSERPWPAVGWIAEQLRQLQRAFRR